LPVICNAGAGFSQLFLIVTVLITGCLQEFMRRTRHNCRKTSGRDIAAALMFARPENKFASAGWQTAFQYAG
jgi:hypothetical protein